MNILYNTMDAISYSRMMGYSMNDYGFHQFQSYQGTELPIPTPTSCPCCHKTLANNLIPVMAINNAVKSDNEDSGEDGFAECDVISVYRCSDCNSLFAIWSHVTALKKEYSNDEPSYSCEIVAEYPFDSAVTSFSDEINNLSSDFVEIYNQTESAEHQNLHRICGMGYRKALEFLVDAYIKYKEKTDTIPERDLQKKIQNHITNDAMKTLAEKATWLGNDATHIVNKHPERDVSDMKKFIIQMVKWIDYELSVEDADTIEKR